MFALDGADWRTWTVADLYAVAYLLLRRQYANDPTELVNLYELVGDRDAAAAVTREIMGQPPTLTTDR